MLPFSTLLLTSGLLVQVAATIPTYNVKPTCRAAIELSAVTGRTVENVRSQRGSSPQRDG